MQDLVRPNLTIIHSRDIGLKKRLIWSCITGLLRGGLSGVFFEGWGVQRPWGRERQDQRSEELNSCRRILMFTVQRQSVTSLAVTKVAWHHTTW